MDNRWNRFCEIFKKNYNEREEKVQKVFEQIFAVLFGYDPFDGEIDSHRTLHIGSIDRVIPDIIICDSNKGKDLFIVELKQLNLHFDKKYEEQLFSYMRLLSLNVGVLICDAIYIYVLENGNSSFSKIEIVAENKKGEEFIDMFSKGNFTPEHVKEFVLSERLFGENVQKIREELIALDIKDLVKLYFISNYEETEIDEALKAFDILLKKRTIIPPIIDSPDNPNPKNPNLNKETTQKWVQRIFGYLFKNNILTSEELYRLHDLDYSKKTFGINYAMLVDSERSITDPAGHARYWKKKIGNYFVCSQWWLDRNDEYEHNIKRWLTKVFPDYAAHGLERYR